MDSTTDKERNDHPKWPKDKGPAYLASFVFELATFMMRIGLAVFAHLTIEDMPESFPAGGPRAAEATEGTTTRVRSRQSMADFVAEYPDIDSEIKYKRASMKAYGYLEKGVPHLSNGCNVPCKCDTCGKDDHATAYHSLYEKVKGAPKKTGGLNILSL